MTKLMEWLTVIGIGMSIWLHLVLNMSDSEYLKENHIFFLYIPVILVFIFGLYAATTVLYRTFTFNNCEKAAAELLKDIEDARKDLKRLGYELVDSK